MLCVLGASSSPRSLIEQRVTRRVLRSSDFVAILLVKNSPMSEVFDLMQEVSLIHSLIPRSGGQVRSNRADGGGTGVYLTGTRKFHASAQRSTGLADVPPWSATNSDRPSAPQINLYDGTS